MQSTQTDFNIEKLQTFCNRHSISTKGVLAITIHKNRTSDFVSLVVNFDVIPPQLITNYPRQFQTPYREQRINEYYVLIQENLDCQILDQNVHL